MSREPTLIGVVPWLSPARRKLPPLLDAQRMRVARVPLMTSAQWRERKRWMEALRCSAEDSWYIRHVCANAWEREHRRSR